MATDSTGLDFREQDPSRFFAHVTPSQAHSKPRNQSFQGLRSLRLRVTNLPSGITTQQIHRSLEQYGTLVRIVILETAKGGKASTAEVDFEPVPATNFWNRQVQFHIGNDVYWVTLRPALSQRQTKHIRSPVTDSVTYPERTEVHGSFLEFGFLSAPASMTVMAGCGDGPCKLLLNLKRREIEVHFTFSQISSKWKQREFRFLIALDDELAIWSVEGGNFVLHLARSPWYSKLLSEAKDKSHSRDGRIWSVEDMWARQTDICTHISTYKKLESFPVGLPKPLNAINIARWTTFCFHISPNANNIEAMTTFVNALRDWNIVVNENKDFRFTLPQSDLERDTWHLINGINGNSAMSLKEELSRVRLPFSVRYQLEVCMSHGWLSEYSITSTFLDKLAQWPETIAKQALIYVATNAKRIYDPMVIFTDIEYSKPKRFRRLPDHCVEIHSATVTATGILFHTPSIEITNRIIRKNKSQAHRFLRVRFEDDDYRGQTRLYPSSNNKMITIFARIKRTLTWGIELGDMKYEFLAWGNSQLREHSAYFVAAIGDMTADRIREEMGTFKETVVAKKAARMGQCFSTTKPVNLGRLPAITERTTIPDIKTGRFTFTDGVGKISRLAANLVSSQLRIKGPTPSLFQFRLGGCKGVLAISDDVPGIGVQIRESQFKFNSLAGDLEIIRWAEFWQPFLNRQIILCLSHLGVPTSVFKNMQNEAIKALDQAMIDDSAAMQALKDNIDPNMMTLSLCDLVEAGFRRSQEPFVCALLKLWRSWSLKYLKEKAKIPIQKGAFVLGCVDETATLKGHTESCPSGDRTEILKDPAYLEKLPEIFIQVIDTLTKKPKIIEGLCILARNPSLHPGDIRIVRARNVPALRHMVNVVVMPQRGDRDLPSMCSGGDLDGDDYIVIWDTDLLPQTWNVPPFHYNPPAPREAEGDITTAHLINFFYDYIRYDALGRIAHAHLAAADTLEDGLDSFVCHELLALHSEAVDYPKTGVPAIMDRRLERDRWPHFMEKKNKKEYHSNKVLGQLYDSVQKVKFQPDYNLEFDGRVIDAFEPPKELYNRVEGIKKEYDDSLQRILIQHNIKTEFELWSTFALSHSKASSDYKFHEEIGDLSRTLKEQYYEALSDLAGGKDFDHLAPVAVAAYRLTQYQVELVKHAHNAEANEHIKDDDLASMPFISFPWVLQETLIKIALQADSAEPKKTVATVRDGVVMEQKTDLMIRSAGCGVVEIADIKDLDLRTTKLAQHLPDPYEGKEAIQKSDKDVESEDRSNSENESPETDTPNTDTSDSTTFPVGEESISVHLLSQKPFDSVSVEIENSPQTLLAVRNQNSYSKEESHHRQEVVDCDLNKIDNSRLIERSQPHSIDLLQEIHFQKIDREASPRDHANTSKLLPLLDGMENAQRSHYLSGGLSTPRKMRKTETCYYWKQGYCQYSDQDCLYAHSDTGIPPRGKHQYTCWFWKTKGKCRFTAEDCKLAHWETGVCIPPSDTYNIDDCSDGFETLTRRRSSRHQPLPSPRKRTVLDESDSETDIFERSCSLQKAESMKSDDSDEEAKHMEQAKITSLVTPVTSDSVIQATRKPRLSLDNIPAKEVDEANLPHSLSALQRSKPSYKATPCLIPSPASSSRPAHEEALDLLDFSPTPDISPTPKPPNQRPVHASIDLISLLPAHEAHNSAVQLRRPSVSTTPPREHLNEEANLIDFDDETDKEEDDDDQQIPVPIERDEPVVLGDPADQLSGEEDFEVDEVFD